MKKKELEEKLRGLVIFTEGDGQGQATNTTLEEELGEYAMQKVLDLFSQELDRAGEEGRREAKREAQIEVLTDIFQTCYQEDSKTLELVEEKLSKLTTK